MRERANGERGHDLMTKITACTHAMKGGKVWPIRVMINTQLAPVFIATFFWGIFRHRSSHEKERAKMGNQQSMINWECLCVCFCNVSECDGIRHAKETRN